MIRGLSILLWIRGFKMVWSFYHFYNDDTNKLGADLCM